jgi:hypothetical protein
MTILLQVLHALALLLWVTLSKRIDSSRLLRNANVTNLSESGRRIEGVTEDVIMHRVTISQADSLIVHVATNNLQRDNLHQIKTKLTDLQDNIKNHVGSKCEVALSSVICRRDSQAPKVGQVNDILSRICTNNKWTFINNQSITDLCPDDIHPDDKGLSFLARNFQDFLRCVHPHLFPRTIYPKWVTALIT